MSKRRDPYQATLEVYEKLGTEYLKNRDRVRVKEMYAFMRILPKNGRVLDVGCAGGRDAKEFVQHGFTVVGIDVVNGFLKEARKHVPQALFRKMDVRKMDFVPESFDAVWANAVLLHLKRIDIPKVLHTFRRILKPGGMVHIRVKKGKGSSMAQDLIVSGDDRLFTYFTKGEMERFVRNAGLYVVASRLLPDEFGRTDVQWVSVWARKSE